jgi:hypothetical protein
MTWIKILGTGGSAALLASKFQDIRSSRLEPEWETKQTTQATDRGDEIKDTGGKEDRRLPEMPLAEEICK